SKDSGGGQRAFLRPEVARQVLRRERLALVTQVEERPEKPLGGVARDLHRVLHVPVALAEANEDEMVAVEADAEEAIVRMAVLVAQALEASLDLVNDFLGSGRIRLGANAIGGAFGVLVLDDYPRVDRIGPALGPRELVFHLQLDSRFFLDEV